MYISEFVRVCVAGRNLMAKEDWNKLGFADTK